MCDLGSVIMFFFIQDNLVIQNTVRSFQLDLLCFNVSFKIYIYIYITLCSVFFQENLQANTVTTIMSTDTNSGNLPPGVAPPPHNQLGEG